MGEREREKEEEGERAFLNIQIFPFNSAADY